MALILLVEQEARTVERVRDVLAAEGWQVRVVHQWEDAVRQAATEVPDLLLINPDLPGVEPLLTSLSRRNGGPGTVVLVPERPGVPANAGAYGADDAILKPFSDTDLRQAVRRALAARRQAVAPLSGQPTRGLTSDEIFGDLLKEMEAPEPRPEVAPAPPAALAAPSVTRPPAASNEMEKRLEQTLSGLLESSKSGAAKPSAAPAPPPKSRTDVDRLLSQTLTDIDWKPTTKAGTAAPSPPATAAPAAPPTGTASAEDRLRDMFAGTGSGIGASASSGSSAARPPAAVPPRPAPAVEPAAPRPMPPVAPPPVAPASPAPPAQVMAKPTPPVPPVDLSTRRIPVVARGGGGESFGAYSLLERVAVGGMAELWKAKRSGIEGFQKTVAIKRILPHLNDSPDFVTMLVDEAKLAALLDHPNITQIFELGKVGDDHFIAMEFVEGRDLRSILNQLRSRNEQFPPGLALLIAGRVAGALDYAHRMRDSLGRDLQMVHRDVSPQNLLISYDGQIKLCDFGIVKAVSKSSQTQLGALKGKLQYMSPEQAWGRGVDARSDIFSLGAVLFEMISGKRLFEGSSEVTILDSVREGRSRRLSEVLPGVPGEIDDLVARAVSSDPGARFQSADEMQRRIEEVAANTRPAATEADLRVWIRRLFDQPTGESSATQRSLAAAGAAPAMTSVPAPVDTAHPAVHPTPPARPDAVAHPAEPRRETFAGTTSPSMRGPAKSSGIPPWAYAVAAVAVLGIGAALWLRRTPAPDVEPPPVAVATDSAVAPAVDAAGNPLTPDAAGTGTTPPTDGTAAATGAPGSTGAPGATGANAAPAVPDLARMVDEQVAERERVLRQQYEEERRRLEQQIAQARTAPGAAATPAPTPPPVSAPAAATGTTGATGSGSAAEVPPVPASATPEPPAPAPEPITPEPPPVAAVEETAPVSNVPPPPAGARPVARGDLVGPGPGVVAPVLVSRLEPRYPALARARRLQAEVTVEALVDETGAVTQTRIARGDNQNVGFNESALEAVRRARFRPATKDGVPVKMWKRYTFPFRP